MRLLLHTEAEMTTKSHAAMIVARYQLNRRPWNAERAKAVALLDEAIAEEKAAEVGAAGPADMRIYIEMADNYDSGRRDV